MALFRRSRRGSDHVAEFWRWWSDEGRRAAEQSIAGTDTTRFASTMSRKVDALGPLDWELAEGATSAHVLVISPGGNPDLRALARRVVLAAPEADPTWSYVDTRPPADDPGSMTLSAAGAEDVDFARITVGARRQGSGFDVVVHHPVFADLPPEARKQVAFLALDATLGEVDAELWIRAMETSELPPLDGFGLTALRALVTDVKSQHTDADGRRSWTLLEGDSPRGPIVAMAQVPLHPMTAPLLDTYVAVLLPFADRTADGFPGPRSLDPLRELEDRLVAALGSDGRLVAQQSVGGVRTLHVYVDATTDAVATTRRVAGTWSQGRASVHDMRDPAWDAVRHLRT